MEWFYRVGIREYGPFSATEFRKLVSSGKVNAQTDVRRSDMEGWISASKVKGLLHGQGEKIVPEIRKKFAPAVKAKDLWNGILAKSAIMGASARRLPPYRQYLLIFCIGLMVVVVPGVCVFAFLAPSKKVVTEAQSTPPKDMNSEQLVGMASPSVAVIRGRIESGTGFLVSPNILATNAHVVSGEFIENLKVTFPSADVGKRGPYAAKLIYEDEEIDLAFLSVDSPLPHLNVARGYEFRRGQEVTVIGNPGVGDDLVLECAVSRGVMSSEATINGQKYFQISIAINPGNSGGPTLDVSGQVVGVVTLKASKQEGLGFCIPAQTFEDVLERAKNSSEEVRAKSQAKHRQRALFRYIWAMAACYKFVISKYAEAMETSVEAGHSANDGLKAVSDLVRPQLEKFDQLTVNQAKSTIAKIAADERVGSDLRTRFVDFWTTALEMKSYVDDPRGDISSYRKKANELSDTVDRQSESLRLLLGIELP